MGSTGRFRELELGEQLCFALYSASRAVVRAYGPLLEELGLTYPQYLVMLSLWEDPDRPQTVGSLGRQLGLDSGTLTPLLKRLEAAGLLRRTRDPADERQVRVSLTAKGRNLKARAADARHEVACATGLPPAEIDALKQQIERLREALHAHADQAR